MPILKIHHMNTDCKDSRRERLRHWIQCPENGIRTKVEPGT